MRIKRVFSARMGLWLLVWMLGGYSAAEAASLTQEYRSLSGVNNNLVHPEWGQAGKPLLRYATSDYGDQVQSLSGSNRSNPRLVSNLVFSQSSSLKDARELSDYAWAWGQLLSHDTDHTLLQSGGETANIFIPQGDPLYTPGTFIPVNRSQFHATTGTDAGNPRQQTNNITAWIDANTVYGGRASEGPDAGSARASWLRTGSDGMLEVSIIGGEVYLPVASQKNNAPGMAEGPVGIEPEKRFIAGDVRANEHAVLATLHTLLVREHNRVASLIADNAASLSIEPAARDEEIFQAAKKVVGAAVQAISYNEYLPALGVDLAPYKGYDPTINPGITNEFSTAGFRLGHSQISGIALRLNPDGSSHSAGSLDLFDAFFEPDSLLETGLDPLLRGLAENVQETTDVKMVDGLRNQLFGGPSLFPVADGIDLVALNIQRGREHGLADYNTTRVAYGLAPVSSFEDITQDSALQVALSDVYGDVNDIDLWVGMLAEDKVPGSSLGELNIAILREQFERLRSGDRFWYESDPDFAVGSALGDLGFDVDYFEKLTLGQVIEANSGVGRLGRDGNVFFVSRVTESKKSVPEPSSAISGIVAVGLFAMGKRRLKS